MTWNLVFQISMLAVVISVCLGAVGEQWIKEWRKRR